MHLRLIMVLVIAPLMALAGYFAYLDVQLQRASRDQAHDIAVRTQEENLVNDLVHEMQKERGYSAGFIASKRKNFPKKLVEQRQLTDDVLQKMMSGVQNISQDRGTLYAEIRSNMDQIANMRKQVDALELTVPQMAKFYTSTINKLLTLARPAISGSASAKLKDLLQANVLIGAAKENAGLERAMGATGLGGGFSLALHDRYVGLGWAQMALLRQSEGTLGVSGWLAELQTNPEYQAVAKARKTISEGYESGDFGGLSAPDWFGISTDWINLLRVTELALAEDIALLSREIDAKAAGDYQFTVLLSIGAGLLVMALSIVIFEMLIRRITSLTAVVDGFSRGDFSIFVRGIDGKDELSKMARAIYHFKQDTLEMMRNAEKLEVEQKAKKKEQDFVVDELRTSLGSLSGGDLTVQLSNSFPDDYEDVRKDFNKTISQLRAALGEVIDTSVSIRDGAVEIAQASDDLSQRTESQAATLEETAAALEQLTASVKSAAEGARTVEHTTEEAKQEAAESGNVVQKAVSAMSEIEESSNHIAQIIGVIDDIAFQTNLLALNAGVEAARAGEAGRGFAVVASEVRALAQRSSDAAMEIKSLIGKSSHQVEHGVDLVRQAGEALESIVQRVTHISDLVSEIATGASEQSSGLGEINTGVLQLDEVTQQNAAMVEQSTAASHMLRTNAQRLNEVVGAFSISAHPTAASRQRARAQAQTPVSHGDFRDAG